MYYYGKRGPLKTITVWFSVPELELGRYSVIHMCDVPHDTVFPKGAVLLEDESFSTLITDLRPEAEEIMKRFRSNVRNEIRRAAREGTRAVFCGPEEDLTDLIPRFQERYDRMHEDKGMERDDATEILGELAGAGRLMISRASIGGEDVAWHTYAIGDERDKTVRLLHSVSDFRGAADPGSVGRANRFLHYEDMLRFKAMGQETYDWGGYSDREELKGIDSFKLGFGGEPALHRQSKLTGSRLLAALYKARGMIKR